MNNHNKNHKAGINLNNYTNINKSSNSNINNSNNNQQNNHEENKLDTLNKKAKFDYERKNNSEIKQDENKLFEVIISSNTTKEASSNNYEEALGTCTPPIYNSRKHAYYTRSTAKFYNSINKAENSLISSESSNYQTISTYSNENTMKSINLKTGKKLSIEKDRKTFSIEKINKSKSKEIPSNIIKEDKVKKTNKLDTIKEIKSNFNSPIKDQYNNLRSTSLGGKILFRESDSKIARNVNRYKKYNELYNMNNTKNNPNSIFNDVKDINNSYSKRLINNICLCFDKKELDSNEKAPLYLLVDNDLNIKNYLKNNILNPNNSKKYYKSKGKYKELTYSKLGRLVSKDENMLNKPNLFNGYNNELNNEKENIYALYGLYHEKLIGLSLKWQIPLNTRVSRLVYTNSYI